MKPLLIPFALILAIGCLCGDVVGDLVTTGFDAFVQAELEFFNPVVSSSAATIDTLLANVTGSGNGSTSNSSTQSDLDYTWNAIQATLSGSGLVSADKSVNAKPGGIHHGDSDLSLTFEIDSLTDFSINGTY